MFGAGTDYCLLIVARYRDELRAGDGREAAMARARRSAPAPAILSAGAIVVVAMLTLALADFNATREMGPILALGVAIMVAAGLTLLPAILAATGPRRAGRARRDSPLWRVDRRARAPPPGRDRRRRHAAAAGRARSATSRAASRSSFTEAFRDAPESVAAQRLIGERFIPGRAAPAQIVTGLRRRSRGHRRRSRAPPAGRSRRRT